MTYDALLSLRGWGEAEFRHAMPDLHAAARFALYAERLMPMLRDQQQIQAMKPAPELAMAKIAAMELIPAYRSLLFPEDDDG